MKKRIVAGLVAALGLVSTLPMAAAEDGRSLAHQTPAGMSA